MKPPITYFGGKAGMADLIVSLLPPHHVYLEPFAGSLAVLFAKPPSVHEIVNDVDDAIVTFFRCLRDQPEDLERVCALTPYARAEYQVADIDDPTIDDLERARRFWCRVNQSFAKTAGRRTGWSITTGRTQSPPNSTLSRLGRFAACAERLARVSIENRDAVDIIETLATPDTVIYADPPYMASTRSNRPQGGVGDYRADMLDDDAHERLAGALHATPATVILSGYRSELYDDLYGDWDRHEIQVSVHSSNARRSSRSGRTEVLWSNRPLRRLQTLFEEASAS